MAFSPLSSVLGAPAVAVPAAQANDALSSDDALQLMSSRSGLVGDYGDAEATAEASAIKAASEKAAAKAAAAKAAAAKAAAAKAAAAKAAADKAAAAKAAAAKAAAAKASTSSAVVRRSSGSFAPASNYGLRGGAVKTYEAVMSRFSGINSVGGYRPSSLSNHQDGLAIDFMLTPGAESDLGWAIAKYLVANASALNVDHIIFEQKIWTPANPTWRLMEDRGGITANHMDHVHVSMKS